MSVSSTSSSELKRSAFATHSTPNGVNSRIRLNDATVDIGTQCSGFAVYSVHINLQWPRESCKSSRFMPKLPVEGKIGIRKVEFN